MPEAPRKAVFIDRDGTLVEEVNYLSRVEDLRLFPFTVEAISQLKDAGFLLIVVTNQSGIGRGIFEEVGDARDPPGDPAAIVECDRRLLFLPASSLRRLRMPQTEVWE